MDIYADVTIYGTLTALTGFPISEIAPFPKGHLLIGQGLKQEPQTKEITGALSINENGITTFLGVVKKDNIASSAVTSETIKEGSLSTKSLKETVLGGSHLAESAVTTSKVIDGAIEDHHFQRNAISGSHIRESSISGRNLADGSITTSKISPNSIS